MGSPGARDGAVVEPPTRAGGTVLVFLLLLAAIGCLDRICISTASFAIQRDLGITKTQMGTVFSAFIVCYALFEVPAGWLADRFGPRLVLTRIVVSWSLITALTGAAMGFASLLVVRALFGAAAQPLSVWLQELVTWRWTFVIFASLGFVWAGAWYVWFCDDPHEDPGVNAAELSLIGSPPPTPH